MDHVFRIIVPVLDESAALPPLLLELRDLDLLSHTIFVDNGSRDGSQALMEDAGGTLIEETRRGYGYPCLAGAREARRQGAEVVVFMEADGTDDPAQVAALVAPVMAGRADLVLATRREAVLGLSEGRMPLHHRLGSLWIAFNLRVLFGLPVADDAPFRAVSTDLLGRLRLEERAYAFPVEMAAKARLAGARILVMEARYRPRLGGSKIAGSWRGTWGALRDIYWCLLRLGWRGFRL